MALCVGGGGGDDEGECEREAGEDGLERRSKGCGPAVMTTGRTCSRCGLVLGGRQDGDGGLIAASLTKEWVHDERIQTWFIDRYRFGAR